MLNNKAFMDLLVEHIVAEVKRRLALPKPKRALVVFTGAAIGFKESMASLKQLQGDGWELLVYLSDEAQKVLDADHIQEELKLDTIYNKDSDIPQKDLWGTVDQFILATTTINTAAKLACGIADNDLLTLLNHCLMAGVPGIVAVDGACPDNEVRAGLGLGKSPEGYRRMLKGNLETLRDFGLKLAAAEELYGTCTGFKAVPQASPEAAPTPANSGSSVRLDKRIISRGDILKNANQGTLVIPQNSIITEYAVEAIAEFGIQVERV